MAKIYEIYGGDAHAMTMQLMRSANVAGMIPKGAQVALKPNLVLDSPPEMGAVTHSGVVSGCIEYLREHGFAHISVIESAWVGAATQRAMKAAGYEAMLKAYGVAFYDLKRDETRLVKTPLRPMEICRRALEADFLIDLPVLKGHCQTAMTCALKNLKGCIPDAEKRRFHTEGLHEPIAALAATLTPGLTIVDSICGDLDFEEGGTPVETNRMFLGTDPVMIDAYGCVLMGLDLSDVRYIGLAAKWGAGSTEWDAVVRLNAPERAAGYVRPSGTVARLSQGVDERGACSVCMASLVRALHIAGNPHRQRIAIGQGFRGRQMDGLGIGRCCEGASRHVAGCPPTAAEIVKVLKDKP